MAKEEKKGFVKEFKEFILRGNVIDLAVGVIIGGAFQAIINSFINDLIMPFIGLLTGGINFADQFIVLNSNGESFATAEAAAEAGYSVFAYGAFITAVINFLVIALVVFLMVKAINKARDAAKKGEAEEEEAPATKVCPYCKSEIDVDATRCPHCTSEV